MYWVWGWMVPNVLGPGGPWALKADPNLHDAVNYPQIPFLPRNFEASGARAGTLFLLRVRRCARKEGVCVCQSWPRNNLM